MSHSQVTLAIADATDTAEARRAAVVLARELGFGDTDQGRVALAVAEAGTNILKHAGSGQIVIGIYTEREQHGVELIALDRGPGMADVERCMQDGYSTAGSPGTGLGAIRRMASLFDVHSAPGAGTALLARVAPAPPRPYAPPGRVSSGAVSIPLRGEQVCGDQWELVESAGRVLLMVADGLGHGPHAFTASDLATRLLREHAQESPKELLERMHGALRGTRGAAAAIAELRCADGEVRYAGVGNISAMIATPAGSRSLVSQNGTLGAEARRLQQFEYPWQQGSLLVMYSDGLGTHWSLTDYPGLFRRHPSLIAGVLYRDHARGRDDATVVVMREAPA